MSVSNICSNFVLFFHIVEFFFIISDIFLKDFIYLFLERGKEGEREGEKHQSVPSPMLPPGDQTHNLGMTGN